ncbi:hypothetical protein, partial [Vibrio parahaemolyticus]|uniref:hypothetical protein n=1 Tax=Vibrio parahaemolyticus TaxID=670 RepID=UPI0031343B7F
MSGVMGPDEFHEKYADAQEGGLKDNAYTNLMVAWLFNEMTTLYRDKRVTDKLSEFGFSANTLDKLCQIKKEHAGTPNQED